METRINSKKIFKFEQEKFFIKNEDEIYYLDDKLLNEILLYINENKLSKDLQKINKTDLQKNIDFLFKKKILISNKNNNWIDKIYFVGNSEICNKIIQNLKQYDTQVECSFIKEVNNLERLKWERSILISIIEYENIQLHQTLNSFCIQNKVKWLKVNCSDDEVKIGPLFLSSNSSCYDCYIQRKMSNDDDPEGFLNQSTLFSSLHNEYIKSNPVSYESKNIVTGFTINEIKKIMDKTSLCISREYILNLPTMELSINPINRIPFCETCH